MNCLSVLVIGIGFDTPNEDTQLTLEMKKASHRGVCWSHLQSKGEHFQDNCNDQSFSQIDKCKKRNSRDVFLVLLLPVRVGNYIYFFFKKENHHIKKKNYYHLEYRRRKYRITTSNIEENILLPLRIKKISY